MWPEVPAISTYKIMIQNFKDLQIGSMIAIIIWNIIISDEIAARSSCAPFSDTLYVYKRDMRFI